jgi:hypothetical protein
MLETHESVVQNSSQTFINCCTERDRSPPQIKRPKQDKPPPPRRNRPHQQIFGQHKENTAPLQQNSASSKGNLACIHRTRPSPKESASTQRTRPLLKQYNLQKMNLASSKRKMTSTDPNLLQRVNLSPQQWNPNGKSE